MSNVWFFQCCGDLKVKQIFYFILFFCLFSISQYAREQTSLQKARAFYQKGMYQECLAIANGQIRKSLELYPGQEMLLLYFLTENDLNKLNLILNRIYKKNSKTLHPNFFFLIYVFLDKSMVIGNFAQAGYWGKIFYQRGLSSSLFQRGMYLYASILFMQKKIEKSQKILNIINQQKIKPKQKEKLLLLQTAAPNPEFRLQAEIFHFAYRSRYRKFIFQNLIRLYIQKKQIKKARKLYRFYRKNILSRE